MNKIVKSILGIAIVAALAATGCATKRVTQVDPNTGATNTVVVVNQENLDIDASVLQGVTAIAVVSLGNNPQAVAALKNAHVALDGILSGVNQQTSQQVIQLLKAQNNDALSVQVDSLLKAVSAIEQKLLAKYGATVAGQITIALTKAVNAGLVVGLAGK